jgi:general secretion pathway protein A
VTTSRSDEPVAEGYERFFGFKEPPFSLAPNPRFLFESASHAAALAQVAYAIERREPLVVITGEIGIGKTLLCRTVLQRLERKTFVSVINDPMLDRDDLLKHILQDFGVISKDRTRLAPTSRHDLIHALQEFLASLAPLRAHAVLIVDEAQHLQPDVLEQIRLLSNIDDERGTLLQIILVGQSDLDRLLGRPDLRQFQQRVSRRVQLAPLTEDELKQYIEHRLAVARDRGSEAPVETAMSVAFTAGAIQALANLSGGVPRVVNILCDRALEAAHTQWLRTIDAPLIKATADALGMPVPAGAITESAAPITGLDRAEDFVPAIFRPGVRAARTGASKGIFLTAALLLTAVLIWFGVRTSNTPAAEPAAEGSAPAAGPPATATSPPAASAPPPVASSPPQPAVPTPDAVSPSTPPDPATRPPAAATVTSPGAPPLPAGPAVGQRFEIVVASFRTETRAASVAAQVTALGLPIRRRVAEGWQQVLAGPFASRVQAEEARQRLDEAGLTGTQVVPTNR